MEPDFLELELERCIDSGSHQREHVAGLLDKNGGGPLSKRAQLQLQFLVLQEKLEDGIIDEDVVAVANDLGLRLTDHNGNIQHQIVLRTQAALHVLESESPEAGDFTEAVEDLFEACDARPDALSAALAERKIELLHFFRALSECAEGSMGHSDVVAAMSLTYPKEEALAVLQDFMNLLRAHLQSIKPGTSSTIRQAEASRGATAAEVNEQDQPPTLVETATKVPAYMLDAELADSPCSDIGKAVSPPQLPTGSEEAAAGSDVGMQPQSVGLTQTNSDVDVVNTPLNGEALRLALRMPSAFAATEPPLERAQRHSPEPAAAGEGGPQAVAADAASQPDGLTESQHLVPDSYPSDKPAAEAQPDLNDNPPAELHPGTQYQDAMHDLDMPDHDVPSLPLEVADLGQGEDSMDEEDVMDTENQENCSLHSNSQTAAAAGIQDKKSSQEGSIGEKGSQDRPQQVAPSTSPEEAGAAARQSPHIIQASESPSAVLRGSVPLQEGSHPLPEAATAGIQAGMSRAAKVSAGKDAGLAHEVDEPAADVVTDVEDKFHDAQAMSSSEGAQSEGDSSESDYDSPSWQGSGEDLMFPSEQQSEAARSQLPSQGPALHLSLGISDSQYSHAVVDLTAQGGAVSQQSPPAVQDLPPEGAGQAQAVGEDATGGSMARMTVLTKPDALAQPRRHRRARRRPQRVVRPHAGGEQSQQPPAAADPQAAEAGTANRAANAEAAATGSVLKEPSVQPFRHVQEEHRRAAAISALTANEVVRSLLQPRSPAAPLSPSRGLTELMEVVQCSPSRGAVAAATGQPVACAQPPASREDAQETAPPAAASDAANLQEAGASAPGNACRPTEGGIVQDSEGEEEEETAAAEPAWRTRGSAAARSCGHASTAVALEEQLCERVHSLHSTQPTAGRMSAPASTPGDASNSGGGQESWTSLIAGLSFSAALQDQTDGALAAKRQPPHVEKGAPSEPQASAPDQAQRLLQIDTGRRKRMSEISFSATVHGPIPDSRVPSAERAAPLPAAQQAQSGAVPERPHRAAHPQSAQLGLPVCSNDSSEVAVVPDQAQVTKTMTNAAAVLAGRKKRRMHEGTLQQAEGVPSSGVAPTAKRQKLPGSSGGLWDLANSVMLDMAQRLMPGAPSVQSAPPQAPLAAQQPHAPAESAPPQQTVTEDLVPSEEAVNAAATPPAVQTAALRKVVEAAIANPGAVALPTLVPLRFQKANQKADAAVRAVSARRNTAQLAARPSTPPLQSLHASQPAAPASTEQLHRPSRIQHHISASVAMWAQPGWDAAVQQPLTQLPSPEQFADEGPTAGGQHYSGAVHLSAAQAPGMCSPQQPLTQLPWQGGDDSAMIEWPEQPPAFQPWLPLHAQEGTVPAQVNASPWVRPVVSAAQQSRHTVPGPESTSGQSREQRQCSWQQEATASRHFNPDMRPGSGGGAALPANTAPQGSFPRQQRFYPSAAADQGVHSPSQPMLWASSAAQIETGHFQQYHQQQQDFSFARPQSRSGDLASPQLGPAPTLAFGFPTHAPLPWQPPQCAAGSSRQCHQTQSPGPLYPQGYQQDMTRPPQAGYAHAHQQPAQLNSAGHPGWNAEVQPGVQLGGRPVPTPPAQQQQQPIWQPQQQPVQGAMAEGTVSLGAPPVQYTPPSWDAAQIGMQQQQLRQQVFQPGYVHEHSSALGQMAGESMQQTTFAPALQSGQQYPPARVPYNSWT